MSTTVKKMNVPPLALDREYQEVGSEMEKRVAKVLASGYYILGEEVSVFQKAFAQWVGAPYAVGLASGSDALYLALQALGIGPGDEVITTPFTYFATVGAIVRLGAKPVFADIDPRTYALDAEKAEKKITKKTKALLPVHLYGQCADMKEFLALAKKQDLALVEDAAQAHGAEYQNQKAGSFGDAGCFSFYPTKNLGAYGDAGALTVKDEELHRHLLSLRVHGSLPDDKYFHQEWGANSRLDEIQAAVLNVKLPHLDEWTEKRRQVAYFYDAELESEEEWLEAPLEAEGRRHVYHQYVVRTSERNELKKFLNEKGIAATAYYPYPLHELPPLKQFGYKPGDFPDAERASEEVLALPCFPQMTKDEMGYVVEMIRAFPNT
jgi:dTDP-4-amino-4,6-dideoxygalactose transaminase